MPIEYVRSVLAGHWMIVAKDPGEWGPGAYTPVVEWFSLWFPAAYAVALLALAVRVLGWLGRLLRATIAKRKPA